MPVINALTFLLFGLIVHILSGRRISGLKTALFVVFLFGTIGIPGYFAEQIGIYQMPGLLNITQPIMGIVYILYPMEFMYQQSGIPRWKTFLLSLVAVSLMLGLRVLFLV